VAFIAAILAAVPAAAVVAPYRQSDPGGFRNILPPGANGFANGVQLAQFLTAGARPPHNDEQLPMYRDLIYAVPGLKAEDLPSYYKDASFGVKPEDVERTYSPREDVTILRDKQFGVPHIYGQSRAGAMFGAGYVAAEDRLFFIDILRHLGRAQLSSFAGGAEGNRELDADQWSVAPYTEADLQRQVDQFDDLLGPDGAIIQEDSRNYVQGVNAYIAEARANPFQMPGEYAAIGKPDGPDDWQTTDIIAIAGLVGALFGKGGGNELGSAAVLQEAQERFGARVGKRVWRDFREAEDPEAPTTVFGRKFPYERPPRKRARGSLALPDPGSVKPHQTRPSPAGGGGEASAAGILGGFPRSASNALVVSGRESESGHPLAVFGPQTPYFSPQILMEQDIHAPPVGGPSIDARGAAFPGTNLYVQLGRGQDYSWSATSAGQDNIDTFALDLCEPDGSAASLESMHYRYRGECRAIEVMERTNSWSPTAADQTPAGSETLRAERTALGIVAARATVGGKPVVYTRLRSTYFHEIDSAPGLLDINTPERINGPRDFQRAMHKVGYTFNWFYVDDRDIAYYNSGNNPIRARGVDANLPVSGDFAWRDWNPDQWTATFAPFSQHPQVINQSFLTSWNNKQAPAYRAADDRFNWGSVDRVMPLNDRIRRGIRGREKMTLVELVEAMEDAGTVDLRADKVLPWILRVLGRQSDPDLAAAVEALESWRRDGSHRIDRDRDGSYEHSEAIALLDAWWPKLVEAQFKPALGEKLYERIAGIQRLDDDPNAHGQHLGSAYDDGWYGFVQKDLRTILGGRTARRVKGRYSRVYCGGGRRAACREALRQSLREAAAVDRSSMYRGDSACSAAGRDGDQTCWDAIVHRPLGALTQPLIPWVNRPTFQQAVEVQGPAGG
jgi:acyl-homoserine lactone acylase PvdQ